MQSNDLKSQIKEKTKLLVEAKTRYNQLVRSVEKELKDKIDQLKDPYIHVSLDLAGRVVDALDNDFSKLPDCVRDLQRVLSLMKEEEDINENEPHDISNLKVPVNKNYDFHSSISSDNENHSPKKSIKNRKIGHKNSDVD